MPEKSGKFHFSDASFHGVALNAMRKLVTEIYVKGRCFPLKMVIAAPKRRTV